MFQITRGVCSTLSFAVLLFLFQQELPAPILDDVAGHTPVEPSRLSCDPQDASDAMKIAWRYQNLPKVQVTFQNVHVTLSSSHVLGAIIATTQGGKNPKGFDQNNFRS